jgi:transcription initiation factor TFIIIB Brf1 subunit/transcription initiation factor TFIIB
MALTMENLPQIYRKYINFLVDEVNSVDSTPPDLAPGGINAVTLDKNLINIVDIMLDQIFEIDEFFLNQKSPMINLALSKEAHSDNFDDILTEPPQIIKSKCKECGAVDSMVEDEKHCCIVCSRCGFQTEELLEMGPEWHQYNNDDGRNEGISRCGPPTSYYFPKSSQGTIITGLNNSRLSRKHGWNQTDYQEHTLSKHFDIISEICSKNKISRRIADTAKFFFKVIADCKYKTGKNTGKQVIIRGPGNQFGMKGACISIACETNHDPRTPKEIAVMVGVSEKRLSKNIKKFEKIIKNSDNIDVFDQIHNGTPEDHIRKYGPKLGFDLPQIDLAVKIANNCSKLKLATDHGAPSIGAGVTLLMANYIGLNVDKRDIAYWFKTSEVTVTKIHNKIAKFTKALVADDDVIDHLIIKFKVNG